MDGIVTTLEEQLATIRARLAELGLESYPVSPNSGTRRTESKRALLRELEAVRAAKRIREAARANRS